MFLLARVVVVVDGTRRLGGRRAGRTNPKATQSVLRESFLRANSRVMRSRRDVRRARRRAIRDSGRRGVEREFRRGVSSHRGGGGGGGCRVRLLPLPRGSRRGHRAERGHVLFARLVHLRGEDERRAVRVEVHGAKRSSRAEGDARDGTRVGGRVVRGGGGGGGAAAAGGEGTDEGNVRRGRRGGGCVGLVGVFRGGGGGGATPVGRFGVVVGVELVSGCDGEDVALGVESEAGDGLREVETHDALRGGGVPHANLMVEASGREDVGVGGVVSHHPGGPAMARQRSHASTRAAVDELHRVVAVRRREELPVGAERRRDG